MTEDAKKLLAASGLPADVQTRIAAIAEQSGLEGERQLDVVRELVAHFANTATSGRPMHPRWLRCASSTCRRGHASSPRLASGAPRPPIRHRTCEEDH